MKILVEPDDIEVNTKDGHSRSPLSYAAQNGHGGVVKILVLAGQVVTKDK